MLRKKNSDYIKELEESKRLLVIAFAGQVTYTPNDTLIKAAKRYKTCFDKVKNKNALSAYREDSILHCSALSIAKNY